MGKVLAFRVGANLAAVVTLGERHVDMGLLAEVVGTYLYVCVCVCVCVHTNMHACIRKECNKKHRLSKPFECADICA